MKQKKMFFWNSFLYDPTDIGSKLEKEYIKAVHCHHLFNIYAEYIMWNAGLDEAQGGIKSAGRNINNLRYTDDTTLMTESFFPVRVSKAFSLCKISSVLNNNKEIKNKKARWKNILSL